MAELSTSCRLGGFPLTRGSLSGGWVGGLVEDRYVLVCVTEGGISRSTYDKIPFWRVRGNLLAVRERSLWSNRVLAVMSVKDCGFVSVKNTMFFCYGCFYHTSGV